MKYSYFGDGIFNILVDNNTKIIHVCYITSNMEAIHFTFRQNFDDIKRNFKIFNDLALYHPLKDFKFLDMNDKPEIFQD